MVLTGVWLDEMQYKMTDSVTGKTDVATIPTKDVLGRDIYDGHELQELAHFARDQFAKRLKTQVEKPPLTKQQGKDLGGVLLDIRASHARRTQSLHGRYW